MMPEQRGVSGGSPDSCAHCQKDATKWCGGCYGAPVYDAIPLKPTFYCSLECQKAGWSRHKADCQLFQARISLYRAATLLQAMMCRIRRNAYPLLVDSIHFDSTNIALGVSQTNGKGSQQRLYPFPVHLTTEGDLLNALLLHSASADAAGCLYGVARKLFDGPRFDVEELSLIPKGQLLRISMTTLSGSQIKPQDSTHHIYKVSLQNGETWAVDITGAQYGYYEVLYRWDDYRRERCERTIEQHHFGYLRQNLESFLQSPMGKTLAGAIDDVTSSRVELYGGQLVSMLKGSEAKFQAASQEFVQQFETDVLVFLKKISESSHPLTKSLEVVETLSQSPLVNTANKVKGTRDLPTQLEREFDSSGRSYAIRAIPGKGKGMLATSNIPKGTRILSEVPIFLVPRDNPNIKAVEHIVANEVKGLDEGQQRAFFDLANIYGSACDRSLGIARTNVLPLGSNARSGGLFLDSSRINHSCRHNAQNTWNENIGRLTIHALRDIEEGQEITISYLASTLGYAERQHFLREKFKFDCKCELCSLPPPQREESDIRLRKLEAIDSTIGMFFYPGGNLEPDAALSLLHTMFSLFDQEGISDARIARAYNDAYQIAVENEDEARAQVFAERAYNARLLAEGDDSPVTLKMKRKMKRAAEEKSVQTPECMSEAQFENWLWMLKAGSADARSNDP